tara:strand:- start:820 stop:1230 length:411 start_codon:yes stop_codon:yes gene_type:complete
MATRASIKISNSDGSFVANIYHHYDGYPEALGARLIEICDSGKIVNGLTLAPGKKFNGFSDLACSIVFELKESSGDGRVYLNTEDDFGHCGEDYLYEIVENPNDGAPLILVMNPFKGHNDPEPELVSDVLERVSNV